MTGSNGVNGNQPGGGQPDNRQTSGDQPDWASFAKGIDALGDRLSTELGGRLDSLRSTVTEGFTREPDQPPVDPNAGFDFDVATPRQLYDHMMGQFETMIGQVLENFTQDALAPYAEQINSLRHDVTYDRGEREIGQLQSQNKDFADWVPEMKAISQRHTSLSLAEVYRLAKSSNPDKAKELDTKYNPPPPPPQRPFSLAPSGSIGDGTGGNNAPRRMSNQEAVQDALSQVRQRHPGVWEQLENRFPGE